MLVDVGSPLAIVPPPENISLFVIVITRSLFNSELAYADRFLQFYFNILKR